MTATPSSDYFPLSFPQESVWFLDQLDPGAPAYNVTVALRLRGALDASLLERCIREIIGRHQTLRTRFLVHGERPVQDVTHEFEAKVYVVDIKHIPEATRDHEIQRLVLEESQRPFDLTVGNLIRTRLLRIEDSDHLLIVVMHHIVVDGWSIEIFLSELAALYGAFLVDRPSPLPNLPLQYTEFVLWQHEWLQGRNLEELLSYWKGQLSGAQTSLRLGRQSQRREIPGFGSVSHARELSAQLSDGLRTLSRREGVTLFMVVLAAFSALIFHHTGQDDILVGSPIAGRNRLEFERIIGLFMNTLVLRIDLSGSPTIRELLARVRKMSLAAYGHQDLPFSRLVEGLRPQRRADRRNPFFEAYMNMHNYRLALIGIPGLEMERVAIPTVESPFDLALYCFSRADRFRLQLTFNVGIFSENVVLGLLADLELLLIQVVDGPERKIDDMAFSFA